MKVFIVFAHPSAASLNSTLKNEAVLKLQEAGHEVQVSDLYAMKWKAVADEDDFPQRDRDKPLNYEAASGVAYNDGTQSADVAAEQAKLLWAEAVVLQFPLWWYGMPAILKGWVERVYAKGFAYGRGVHGKASYGERYGEGILQGKRAMVCVTVGGRVAHYGPRGIGGQIDDILWPIQHGVLFYPGMTVVPPTTFYEVRKANEEAVRSFCTHYVSRLLSIMETDPIPYRTQNGGDYDAYQTVQPRLPGEGAGQFIHQSGTPFVAILKRLVPRSSRRSILRETRGVLKPAEDEGERMTNEEILKGTVVKNCPSSSLKGESMESTLAGKVAVITGGSEGIGLASAQHLAARGAVVFITGRRQSVLDEAASKIPGSVITIQADASKPAELKHVFEVVRNSQQKLDILVINAGVQTKEMLGSITEEALDYQLSINFKGVIFTMQEALPLLVDGASVVLLSSSTAIKGLPARTVYSATKAAIRSFARTWANELKDRRIRVNALSPGPIMTPAIQASFLNEESKQAYRTQIAGAVPLGRTGQPEEMGEVVAFLASAASSFINGADIQADGGFAQV